MEAIPPPVPATMEAIPPPVPATMEAIPPPVPATMEAIPPPVPATMEAIPPPSTQAVALVSLLQYVAPDPYIPFSSQAPATPHQALPSEVPLLHPQYHLALPPKGSPPDIETMTQDDLPETPPIGNLSMTPPTNNLPETPPTYNRPDTILTDNLSDALPLYLSEALPPHNLPEAPLTETFPVCEAPPTDSSPACEAPPTVCSLVCEAPPTVCVVPAELFPYPPSLYSDPCDVTGTKSDELRDPTTPSTLHPAELTMCSDLKATPHTDITELQAGKSPVQDSYRGGVPVIEER
ncbi:hypothetical protein FKM82_029474 [Ascaphus truei]